MAKKKVTKKKTVGKTVKNKGGRPSNASIRIKELAKKELLEKGNVIKFPGTPDDAEDTVRTLAVKILEGKIPKGRLDKHSLRNHSTIKRIIRTLDAVETDTGNALAKLLPMQEKIEKEYLVEEAVEEVVGFEEIPTVDMTKWRKVE